MWMEILQGDVEFLEGGLVASTRPLGDNADFYKELFSPDTVPDISRRTKWHDLKRPAVDSASRDTTTPPDDFCSALDYLEKKVGRNARIVEVGGGIYQSRCCNACERFPNYLPVDLSASSICRYARKYGRQGIVANATNLPLKDSVVDAVFTRTFLEHVPNPEAALREIFRVLRPGGVIVHEDAWFCRWWQRFGVVGLIAWKDMTLPERVLSLAAHSTEFWPIRACHIVFRRTVRELFCRSRSRLHYGTLRPNYSLHLGCDEDAASSLDPAEVLRFYCSLGGDIKPYDTARARIFLRRRRITIQKPG